MATMRQPDAQSAKASGLRGDYSRADADFVIDQQWGAYTPDEHALWGRLVERQYGLIRRYAARQVIEGLATLRLDSRVPNFEQASEALERASGWRIVAVPGLIPDANFFAHLARRRFPVTVWLRTPGEMDYLAEPDVFHDFFGHVPLLCDPVFGDFMQAYGVAGAKAQSEGGLKMLARLYWYCVEFGLLEDHGDLRAYGAGILSSAGETVYSIEDERPHRVRFNLERIMRTDYMIDSYQKTYFVVKNFEQMFRDSYDRDFAPLYRRYRDAPSFAPDCVQAGDVLVSPGRSGPLVS